MTRSLIRVTSQKLRQTALLMLAMFIGWTSATQLLASTPIGVHCPTAAIQTVTVPVKICCALKVSYIARKPQLGDKAFVQCRCAEKRSATQQAGLNQNTAHCEMMPPQVFAFFLPGRIPEAIVEPIHVTQIQSVPAAPLVPPPSVV